MDTAVKDSFCVENRISQAMHPEEFSRNFGSEIL